MIYKACKAINDTIKGESSDSINTNFVIKDTINTKFPVTKDVKKVFQNIADEIVKQYGKTAIPEKELDKLLNQKLKGQKEPKKLATIFKIQTLLNNKLILEIFSKDFKYEGISASTKGIKGNYNGNIFLDTLPINTIGKFYHKLIAFENAKVKENFTGSFGNAMVSLSTPRNMRWKDRTGAIAVIVNAVETFLVSVNQHISKYMGNPTNKKMSDIYQQVQNIAGVPGQDDENRLKAVKLFSRIMSGWMSIENGTIMINSSVGISSDPNDKRYTNSEYYTYDKEYNVWRYTSTNDKVKDFQNKVLFSDYVLGKTLNKTDKAFFNKIKKDPEAVKRFLSYGKTNKEVKFVLQAIELNKLKLSAEKIKVLQEQITRARKIHSSVFNNVKSEFEKLDSELRAELTTWLPKIKDPKVYKSLTIAFITGDFNAVNNKGEYWIKDPNDRRIGKYLHDKFGKTVILNVFENGLVNLKERKNSFPTIYQNEDLRFHYDEMINDNKELINDYEDKIKNTPVKDRKPLLEEFDEAKANLARLENTLGKLDEAMEDPIWHRKIYSSNDAKSFRRITNSIDIRESRDDVSLYRDYLTNLYSTLERGKLARKAIRAVRQADPNLDGSNKEIVDYILGLYDTTLHKPEARANVFGADLSLRNVYEGFFKKLPFKVDEYKLDRYVRTISAAITGRYLGGYSTAVLNKTATLQKAIHVGWKRYSQASDNLNSYKEGLDSIIQDSGILDFGDFFSNSLVQDLTQRDNISLENALAITELQFEYWNNVNKGMSKKAAEKIFRDKCYINAKNIPAYKDLKTRKRTLREKKLKKIVDRWANWAITKEYQAYPIRDITEDQYKLFKQAIRKINSLPAKTFESINKTMLDVLGTTFTMSGSEKELRSHSFVIGIDLAINAGILDKDFYFKLQNNQLTNEDKIQAIEIGREMTRVLDFGLSNQDIGEIGRFAGGINTKFTIWAQQKFGYDSRLFRDAYRSMKIKEGNPLFNTMKELLSSMSLTNPSKAWEKNADIARLRNFILMQGPLTLIMDLVLFSPIGGPFLRRLPIIRNTFAIKIMSGISSDLLSLTVSTPLYILMAMMSDWDEEDVQEDLFYKFKKIPFLGYGYGFALDTMYLLLGIATDMEEEDALKKANKLVGPFIPLPPPAAIAVEEAVDMIVD